MTSSKESVIEHLQPLTTTIKQRFVSDFTGNDDTFRDILTYHWTLNGTNTSGMLDEINGGYEITPAAGQNVILYTNNIRQFNYNASAFIVSTSAHGGNPNRAECSFGFSGSNEFSGIPVGSESKACFEQDSIYNYFSGCTSQGTGETITALGTFTFYDGNLHICKGETKASSCEFSHAGILGCVITSNLPDSKMQPAYEVRNIGAGTDGAKGRIHYFEAWNT